MRPRVHLDALVAAYDEAIGKLSATGAHVVMWTGLTWSSRRSTGTCVAGWRRTTSWSARSPTSMGIGPRDLWRMREFRDWRMWDIDRLHLSPQGTSGWPSRVLDLLGVPHDLEPLPLPPVPVS